MTPCPKPFSWRSKPYLAHVRQFPCCVCGYPDTEAHHIRFSHTAGTGHKPGDVWAIPLCPKHHREWHQNGQKSFLNKYRIDIYEQLFQIAKSWIEGRA